MHAGFDAGQSELDRHWHLLDFNVIEHLGLVVGQSASVEHSVHLKFLHVCVEEH